jgi:hypothetical protein
MIYLYILVHIYLYLSIYHPTLHKRTIYLPRYKILPHIMLAILIYSANSNATARLHTQWRMISTTQSIEGLITDEDSHKSRSTNEITRLPLECCYMHVNSKLTPTVNECNVFPGLYACELSRNNNCQIHWPYDKQFVYLTSFRTCLAKQYKKLDLHDIVIRSEYFAGAYTA